MALEHYLKVSSRSGVKLAEVSDFLTLAYTPRVNAPGVAVFTLSPTHSVIPLLELDGQVEVWSRDLDAGIAWHAEFETLYRTAEYQVDENGDEVFTATCVGAMHLLSRRVVAYPAGVSGKSVLTSLPAETVMRTIVDTNCTTNATVANGRLRTASDLGVSVEADDGRGNVVSWSGPGKVVLSELQDLARIGVGGGDFDLVKAGAAAWTFRFYSGQRGTDRTTGSSAVVFALLNGNMGQPHYVRDRVEEKTVAIVGGNGEAQARRFLVRTGHDYSTTNDIETFVDARNASGALVTAGDQALDAARARDVLTFDVLQTPACRYGRHYFLGDLVVARYRTVTNIVKVTGATTTRTRDGDTQVQIELTTL